MQLTSWVYLCDVIGKYYWQNNGAISERARKLILNVSPKWDLKNPRLIGFGISDNTSFSKACQHSDGAIIGSAFIKTLTQSQNLPQDIHAFIKGIKGETVLS